MFPFISASRGRQQQISLSTVLYMIAVNAYLMIFKTN